MILICTPCYGNSVNTNYLNAMVALASEAKVSFDLQTRCNDSLIPRCRNTMVANFLADERNYTHLMWIDSDIGFDPDALYRLLKADHMVAGGVYPFKSLHPPVNVPAMTAQELELVQLRYPFNVAQKEFTIPADGMVEVKDIPCGFMLVKREVFAQMAEAYPDLKYRPDRTADLDPRAVEHHYRFYDVAVEDGRYVSEDFAFCHRWQRIGGKVFADLHSQLSHQGQYLYQGHVLGTLVACGALDQEQLTRAIGWVNVEPNTCSRITATESR